MATYCSKGTRLEDQSVPMSAINTMGAGTNAGRGLSPNIWRNCPILKYQNDPQSGTYFMDDFIHSCPVVAAGKSIAQAAALGTAGRYSVLTGAGETVAPLTLSQIGVMSLFNTTTDGDTLVGFPESALTNAPYQVATGKRFWFETRIALSVIDNTKGNCFVGLAPIAQAAGTIITTSDALSTVTMLGWYKLSADGNAIYPVYNTASGTPVAKTVIVPVANLGTTAGSWKKLGIYSDGTYCNFYVNGVYIERVALAATNFPQDLPLAVWFAVMGDTTEADFTLYVDWFAIAQSY